MSKLCSIDECGRNEHARGWCSTHYQRWRKSGTTRSDDTITKPGSTMEWIIRHVSFKGDKCLQWPFGRWPRGHVSTVIFNGNPIAATRVMCILAHGEPPTPSHEASHNCGKGHEGCINPQHLYWGSHKRNMADTILHGTAARGENNGMAKLTVADVKKIRILRGTNEDVGNIFGVGPTAISRIRLRQSWKHIR